MPKPLEGSTAATAPVTTITVTQAGSNSVNVTVTSGTMTGKTARIITVPPSGAYFNESTSGSANSTTMAKVRA